jgi:hypothetical protein
MFLKTMHAAQRPSRWMVILAFGLVYLFWGSTYLAIDIAVQCLASVGSKLKCPVLVASEMSG